jgi:hypothetical protein
LDGTEITIPSNICGICVLNINSYAGGSDLWGKTPVTSYQDKKFEVIGIKGALELVIISYE